MAEARRDPLAFLAAEATELVRVLAESDVEELELEHDGYRLVLRRPLGAAAPPTEAPAALPASEPTFLVLAPVVGWFRRGTIPEGPPLVEVGQLVEAGQPLAVIEAVEVVHEVVADRPGVLLEVLVADGEGVGYGQPLFRLREPEG
ncbi:MAG: acetyl-CoA carboxylase biotin carboxyl carrier protein subunit [Dehalococcoidia bacterium]|nr:MAG: acetyl-CoA carboxylase biotin carboxyl carrier protein subunit [Dehalococcoidia bacterium]